MVELLVSASVSGIILAGVFATSIELGRSAMRVSNYADMSIQVRRALEQLGSDLKAASRLTWNNASDITVTVPKSDGTTVEVTYAWSGATETFYRVPGTDSSSYTGRRDLVQGIPAAAGGGAGLTFTRLDTDGNTTDSDAKTQRLRVTFGVSRNVGNATKSKADSAKSKADSAKSKTEAATVFVLRNKPVS